jgi:hypothetical protein
VSTQNIKKIAKSKLKSGKFNYKIDEIQIIKKTDFLVNFPDFRKNPGNPNNNQGKSKQKTISPISCLDFPDFNLDFPDKLKIIFFFCLFFLDFPFAGLYNLRNEN